MRHRALLAALCGFLSLPLLADFSYQQTARITGGTMTRMMRMIPGGGKALEPQVSTHLFQGGRMAMVTPTAIDITDVDRQIMTHIDLDKRTYSTITFAEFRQAMDAMMRKMGQAPKEGQPALEFRVDVKDTGEAKTIEGFNTKLMKMLLATDIKDPKSGQSTTMNMDMDMWMASSVPGYEEVRRYMQKYAEAIGITPEMMRISRMAVGQPGMGEGMAKLMKEASKLQGVPVVTVTRMTGMGLGGPGGPGGNDAPDVQPPSGREVGDAAASSAAASALGRVPGLGGLGGRLGGFGRKKKAEEPPKEEPKPETPPPAAANAKPQQSVFMEMTSESSAFSTAAVDASKFAVPAGFKEVEHDMKKLAREAK